VAGSMRLATTRLGICASYRDSHLRVITRLFL
jgi:hypothetical protein